MILLHHYRPKKEKLEHMCSEMNPRVAVSSSLLNKTDEKLLLDGDWLNDNHINLAQQLLSKQFPNLSGLSSTLLLPQAKQVVPADARALQIIHTRGNHWIVSSAIGCQPGEVKIFDSLYKSIDLETMVLISMIFRKEITTVHLEESQQQQGSYDCGIFAIATCTALVHGVTPVFKQATMINHLYECFCTGTLTPFP